MPANRTVPKRINVAVNAEMLAALNLMIEREGVSLTEAVRRLIGYGEFIYRASRVDGQRVLVQDPAEGTTKELVLR